MGEKWSDWGGTERDCEGREVNLLDSFFIDYFIFVIVASINNYFMSSLSCLFRSLVKFHWYPSIMLFTPNQGEDILRARRLLRNDVNYDTVKQKIEFHT